jgi:hypothetical protein
MSKSMSKQLENKLLVVPDASRVGNEQRFAEGEQ